MQDLKGSSMSEMRECKGTCDGRATGKAEDSSDRGGKEFRSHFSPFLLALGLLVTVLMLTSALVPTAQAQSTGAVPAAAVPHAPRAADPLSGWHSYPHLSILLPPGVAHPWTPGPHPQLLPKVVFRGSSTPTNAWGPQGADGPLGPGAITPQLLQNGTFGWSGIQGVAPNPCGCAPPDTNNGEGAGYVVESVNAYWTVWTTTGTFVSGNTLDSFFGAGSDFLSDPQTWYDPTSGHWFQSIIDIQNYVSTGSCTPSCPIDIGVSATSNPSGTWYQYQINDASGILPDQPQIGTDSVALFVSVNDFGSGTEHIFVLNKSQAIVGTTPSEWDTVGPGNLGYVSLHPAHTETASSTEYFMGDDLGSTTTLNMLGIQGSPPTIGKVTWENLTTTEGTVGCLTVPGGGGMCQIDGRVLGLAFYQGTLWGSATDGCSTGDCTHLWEVNTLTNPWTLVSDFTWNPTSETTFYSNLAIDPAGDVGIVFSYSSSTSYPGVGITGRSVVDPAGTLETPVFVKPGYAVGSSSIRYGDYSGAAYDQATGKFWVSGEWIASGSVTGTYTAWSTWVQSFTMASFLAIGGAAPNPTDVGIPVVFNGTEFGGTSPIHYAWTFGDASRGSGAQNPTHAYNTTGTFPVHFWANETTGLLRSRESNFTMTVNALPTAVLTSSPDPTDIGIPVHFTSTVTGGSPAFTYAWAFGDGTTGTGASAWHNYTAAGTYKVAGWANDSAGASAYATQTMTVNPQPSVGFVATPSPSDSGIAVNFVATASGGTGTLTLAWLFGDGTGGTGTSLTHTYVARGNYTVQVWANDTIGGVGNYSVGMAVNPTLHLLLMDASMLVLDAGTPDTFSASYWGGTPSYSESWNFGDGGTSSAASPVHTYPAAGSYTVHLRLNDSGGGSVSASLLILVNPRPLVTSFQGLWPGNATDQIDLGQTVDLRASVSGGTGALSYAYTGLPTGCTTWDQATLSCSPVHTGNYTVHLEVSDMRGVHAFANLTFKVNPDPVVTSFGASPATLTVGATTVISVSASLGTPGYAYSYPVLPKGCTSSNSASLSCSPTSTGTLGLEVAVADDAGVSAYANATVVVYPTLVIVSFTVSPSSVQVGQPVSFQVAVNGGSAPYSYTYTGLPTGCGLAGNGGTCTPSATGTFTVQVVVADSSGQTQTATTSLSVKSAPNEFSGGLFSLGMLWILLLILIVVVLALLLVAARQRRQGKAAMAATPPPYAHAGGPAAWAEANASTTAPSPEGTPYPSEPAPTPPPPPPPAPGDFDRSNQGYDTSSPPPLPPPPPSGSQGGGA